MTIWLKCHPQQGITRFINLDQISEFQVRRERENSIVLFVYTHHDICEIARTKDETQIHRIVQQLLEFRRKSMEAIVEISGEDLKISYH